MIRFDSTRRSSGRSNEVSQNPEADVARFLRVELDAGNTAALHDGRERFAVARFGHGV